jgi:hypothetical protein
MCAESALRAETASRASATEANARGAALAWFMLRLVDAGRSVAARWMRRTIAPLHPR